MFGNDRDRMRRFYVETWRKAQAGEPLEPMERVVADVIADHPEYQALLAPGNEAVLGRDYQPEDGQTNPFLHMGMHIALREQEATDRPPGIADLIQRLKAKTGDHLEAEHRLMEALGETLWEAQRDGAQPDEGAYLERVRRMVG
ncbi:MAG: DUF1841 family protein [Halofilum sp. (in: g-proteobacteria)]|nr:DUF1841 family protein [Halofilum sp. (in: g-proteobacteria)]